MDAELAAMAASGATTLVSLMVTDSWAHARALMGRFLARAGADTTAITGLDDARTRLLLTGTGADEHTTSGIAAEWQTHLCRLVESGALTGEDLNALGASLRRLAAAAAGRPATVHNTVSGGTQHGPIIQAGTVAGLALPPDPSPRREQG
jgi:phage-related minor tail protein